MTLLACENLDRSFGDGALRRTVLRGVSLALEAGQSAVLLGPSGSGKTTLLSILGLLLSPTGGTVRLDGETVAFDDRNDLIGRRRRQVGFVFQNAQLLPFLSLYENVMVVARNAGLDDRTAHARTSELFARLGIADLANARPSQASGGQRQRVAIARALVHRPRIVLADEPTAALDKENGDKAIRALIEQTRVENALLITVTHDTRLVPLFDRVFAMDGGAIEETSNHAA